MTAAQEKLVVDNMALVPYLVNKHFPYQTQFEREDLYSIGYIAMCKAAQDFNPERGWKYVTLAGKYVRSAILNEIQKSTRDCRDVRKTIVTFDQPIKSKCGENGDTLGSLLPSVDDAETLTDAKLLIEWMDKRLGEDARIIRLHIAGYSQSEIAAQFGLTQSGISRHFSAAKQRIREYYAVAM